MQAPFRALQATPTGREFWRRADSIRMAEGPATYMKQDASEIDEIKPN